MCEQNLQRQIAIVNEFSYFLKQFECLFAYEKMHSCKVEHVILTQECKNSNYQY